MEALQILNRSEMKMIKGGVVPCFTTNCILCTTGTSCATFDGKEPERGCSWGICAECCE